jgi:hypothetical protein
MKSVAVHGWTIRVVPGRLVVNGEAASLLVDWSDRTVTVSDAQGLSDLAVRMWLAGNDAGYERCLDVLGRPRPGEASERVREEDGLCWVVDDSSQVT